MIMQSLVSAAFTGFFVVIGIVIAAGIINQLDERKRKKSR